MNMSMKGTQKVSSFIPDLFEKYAGWRYRPHIFPVYVENVLQENLISCSKKTCQYRRYEEPQELTPDGRGSTWNRRLFLNWAKFGQIRPVYFGRWFLEVEREKMEGFKTFTLKSFGGGHWNINDEWANELIRTIFNGLFDYFRYFVTVGLQPFLSN